MNTLHIYPTSRALRHINTLYRQEEGFLPSLMRMDEFEQRAILVEHKSYIDPLRRVLLLKQSAKFEAFEKLKLDTSLVRFFTKSDALFKFFEELAVEDVSFSKLLEADAYVEFGEHLNVLELLLLNYKKLLDAKGFTDKSFISNSYELNSGFLSNYSRIEIHLEGYLSHYELTLLERISQKTELIIHYTTSKFNRKMQERFKNIGLVLLNNKHLTFSLSQKTVIDIIENKAQINASIYSVEERTEQVSLAFLKIDEMVQEGIAPEDIVLILPDESFKEHFSLFDNYNNLNFAMGYNYTNSSTYKSLTALYNYWQTHDKEAKNLLLRYGFSMEKVEALSDGKKREVNAFFELLEALGLQQSLSAKEKTKEKFNERVYEATLHFSKMLQSEKLTSKEWLFLWLKTLSAITIDDVRGGKVTVMGVLETRGICFKGVVIVDFNEGVIPTTSSKDQFLNSSVRKFADLPTKYDREALQKQYYKRLLEEAKEATIIYATSDNRLPSKFLYELGLGEAKSVESDYSLLYNEASQIIEDKDPEIENFDASLITWSASRLKTYLECKRKYYYKYIQKIEPKKNSELNEGAFLHKLLDHLFEENDHYIKPEEMEKEIHLLLDTLLPYKNAKIAYQKLLWKEKLKGFINKQVIHFNEGYRVKHRETEFQAPIQGLNFKGRIDRIDEKESHTMVIDYKSGQIKEANREKNLETLTDFQMSIYHQMLLEKYPNLMLIFIKILANGEEEEIKKLEEKNNLLFQHIELLKETKNFTAIKCEEVKTCTYCEFALMCERGEYLK